VCDGAILAVPLRFQARTLCTHMVLDAVGGGGEGCWEAVGMVGAADQRDPLAGIVSDSCVRWPGPDCLQIFQNTARLQSAEVPYPWAASGAWGRPKTPARLGKHAAGIQFIRMAHPGWQWRSPM
jgi:hypothetical protein